MAATAAASVLAAALLAAPVPARAATPTQCRPPEGRAVADQPWSQALLGSERAWTLSRGAGVTVAVLDTGVSRLAPALAGRVLPGVDVTARGTADSDCTGHGTFVAGLVAGGRVDGAGVVGVAPDARILPVRVIATESGSEEDVTPDTLAAGIDAAVAGGASVIATPATAPYGSPALAAAVSLARRHDVLVIAPASTSRNETGDVAEPAALPGVLSVAGVDRSGVPVVATAPAVRPSLCAPAAVVTSVPTAGGGVVDASGESFAVGYVAGAAALVRGYRPDVSAEQVRQRLIATAYPVAGADPALVGAGMLEPLSAVSAELSEQRAPGVAPAGELPVLRSVRAPVDHAPGEAARRWSVVVAGLAALLALGAMVTSRGRRRGWRASDG